MSLSNGNWIATAVAITMFVCAGVVHKWAPKTSFYSVVFALLIFFGFGILFRTWVVK